MGLFQPGRLMRKINDDKHVAHSQVVKDRLLNKLYVNHKYASLKSRQQLNTGTDYRYVYCLPRGVMALKLIIITVNPVVGSCYIASAVITT